MFRDSSSFSVSSTITHLPPSVDVIESISNVSPTLGAPWTPTGDDSPHFLAVRTEVVPYLSNRGRAWPLSQVLSQYAHVRRMVQKGGQRAEKQRLGLLTFVNNYLRGTESKLYITNP